VTCIGIDFVFTSSTTTSTPYSFISTFSYSTCICWTFARSFALMNGFVYSRWSISSWIINKWIEACCKAMQNQQKHVIAHVLFRWLISLLLMSHSKVNDSCTCIISIKMCCNTSNHKPMWKKQCYKIELLRNALLKCSVVRWCATTSWLDNDLETTIVPILPNTKLTAVKHIASTKLTLGFIHMFWKQNNKIINT
jgi:hypothetical protein